jgi:DNA modification methylase
MYEMKNIHLSELKPHPKNPRIHPENMLKKLCTSIREFGFTSPVLVDSDYRILAGHARCKAAEKLGIETVPAVILPLSGAAADAYVIADNKLNELSEWDENILADLIADIDSANFDVELTGFDADEIDSLMSPKGCIEDDFDEEKAKKEVEEKGGAVTKEGDIIMLGEHKLICTDTTLLETFEKLMLGKKAQLCVTSPPYGLSGKMTYEKGGIDEWRKTIQPSIKNICRNAEIVCWNIGDMLIGNVGGQFLEPTHCFSIEYFLENGYRPIWFRIWNKRRKALSSTSPFHLCTNKPVPSCEYITAFSEGGVLAEDESDVSEYQFVSAFANNNYKFVKRLSKQERREWGYSMTWDITCVNKNKAHPCAYPVELPGRCIRMHSSKGDIVLESFCGSGTTLIACEQLGRVCYAIERDPLYCELTIKRLLETSPDTEVVIMRDGEIFQFNEMGAIIC